MSEVIVICDCGHRISMSEFAVGMPATCPNCNAKLTYQKVESPDAIEPPPDRPDHFDTVHGYQSTSPRGSSRRSARSTPEWRNESRMSSSQSGPYRPQANTELPEFGRCGRCKRPFRGEWDKHATSLGTLCNICANRPIAVDTSSPIQGVAITPKLEARRDAALRGEPLGELGSVQAALSAQPKPEEIEPEPPVSRTWLLVAAGATVLIAVIIAMSDPGSMAPNATPDLRLTREMARIVKDVEPITPAVYWTVKGIDFAFYLLWLGLAIYITATSQNRQPYDSFIPNVVYAVIAGAALSLVQFGIGMLPVPFIFTIVLMLGLSFYILFEFYDFGVTDFMYYLLFCPLCGMLLYFAKTLVVGSLGLTVT